MREEWGKLVGNQVVSEPFTLWGSVAGDVTVVNGAKSYLRGTVHGDLTVLGGRVKISGHVTGTMRVRDGARVILSGTIGQACINEGGRLSIGSAALVGGKRN
jgi:cytoskeletal protein CcmA (bactofilin family)